MFYVDPSLSMSHGSSHEFMGNGGTDMSAALALAQRSVQKQSTGTPVMIMFTDGELSDHQQAKARRRIRRMRRMMSGRRR